MSLLLPEALPNTPAISVPPPQPPSNPSLKPKITLHVSKTEPDLATLARIGRNARHTRMASLPNLLDVKPEDFDEEAQQAESEQAEAQQAENAEDDLKEKLKKCGEIALEFLGNLNFNLISLVKYATSCVTDAIEPRRDPANTDTNVFRVVGLAFVIMGLVIGSSVVQNQNMPDQIVIFFCAGYGFFFMVGSHWIAANVENREFVGVMAIWLYTLALICLGLYYVLNLWP